MPYLDEIHSFNLKCDCDIFDMDISDDKSLIVILNKENNEKKFNIKDLNIKKLKFNYLIFNEFLFDKNKKNFFLIS